MAAALVRALPLADIAAHLDDCFAILGGGDRAALSCQRTLPAAADWSYDLLRGPERTLLS